MSSSKTTMLAAAAGILLSVGARAQGDYRVLVTRVDSTAFPEIALEFQVFTRNPDRPVWTPDMDVKVIEEALGIPKDALRPGRPEVCKIHPVAMAICLDVSGSVTDVLPDMKAGIRDVFESMGENTDTEDAAAVFAFSTEQEVRYPDVGSQPSYTEDTSSLDSSLDRIEGGGGSPIWSGMNKELERLLAYESPEPPDPAADPELGELMRVLVTLTDGQDNATMPTEAIQLLTKAQQGSAKLVNLGYGSQNPMALEMVADASGGVYVPNVDGKIGRALRTILEGARTTYCMTYVSPNQNVVNEPADVTIETGSDRGSARYPLPFVIPEDTRQVGLFMPVTKFTYDLLAAGDALPQVGVTMELLDEDGEAWEAPGPDRAERVKQLEFRVPDQNWRCADEADCGFYIRHDDDPDLWEQLFQIPTQYVELHGDEEKQVIDRVMHYRVDAAFEMPEAGSGAGRKYPSATRLSIQDRTPPHVLVRIRPQDGGPVLEARITEQRPDEDPALFGDPSRPTYDEVRRPGQGRKRARVEFRWRGEAGGEVEGEALDQQWALWRPEPRPADPEVPEWDPVFREGADVAMQDDQHSIFARGVEVPAGTRFLLEVAARDNYALVHASHRLRDQDVFTQPASEKERDGPVHAELDTGEEEARPGEARPPYLPLKTRAELEQDSRLAGVSWWIENTTDGLVPDRYHELEGVTEVIYPSSDLETRDELAGAGEYVLPGPDGSLTTSGPFRVLEIRAQDGLGNVTLIEFPLAIGVSGFHARTLEWETRRDMAID